MKEERGARSGMDEAGQALYETALVLPVLLILLIGVITFGPMAYVRIVVDAASYNCVTAAVEAVSSEWRSQNQGRIMANETIEGHRLNPDHVEVYIWSTGSWGPGAQMVCRVDYDFQSTNIPGVSYFFPDSARVISGETALAVETHKSDWW